MSSQRKDPRRHKKVQELVKQLVDSHNALVHKVVEAEDSLNELKAFSVAMAVALDVLESKGLITKEEMTEATKRLKQPEDPIEFELDAPQQS
jgi:hypothetical protein